MMPMKGLLITLMAAMLVAGSLVAKDDEVIVTRQFTAGQRNMLPEKTITVEMKRLTFDKKADASLVDAITRVMDTIAQEDYQNRTFVLLLEPKGNGEIAIGARSDDIVTRGRETQPSTMARLSTTATILSCSQARITWSCLNIPSNARVR